MRFSQGDRQRTLPCENAAPPRTWRSEVLYNSQPRHAADFIYSEAGSPELTWRVEPCWQVRSCCVFPVESDLWVRMTDQKPLLTCPGIPLCSEVFFSAPHSHWSYKRSDLLLYVLPSYSPLLGHQSWYVGCPENSTKTFSISISNSVYFSVYFLPQIYTLISVITVWCNYAD